MNGALHPVFLN